MPVFKVDASSELRQSPSETRLGSMLYVRVAADSPLGPFRLFDVRADDGFEARDLTARQVDDIARRRGLCVCPVTDVLGDGGGLDDASRIRSLGIVMQRSSH